MAKNKKNKTIEGVRLRQLRLIVGVTLSSLYKITGIATATLSNIEKGAKSYQNSSITNLSEAFGIDRSFFFDLEKALPPRDNLINSLINYSKLRMSPISVRPLLRKNLTALVLDDYTENQLLEEFQNVGTIIDNIKKEYLIQLKSSQTSKILNDRCKKGIIEKKEGQKKRTFEYRRINL